MQQNAAKKGMFSPLFISPMNEDTLQFYQNGKRKVQYGCVTNQKASKQTKSCM